VKHLTLLTIAASLAASSALAATNSAVGNASVSAPPIRAVVACKTEAVLDEIKQLQALIDYRRGLIEDTQKKIDALKAAKAATDDKAKKQQYDNQIDDLKKKQDALKAALATAQAELRQKQSLPPCRS